MKRISWRISDDDYKIYKNLKIAVMEDHLKINGIIGHEILRLAATNPEVMEKNKKIYVPMKVGTRTVKNMKLIFEALPDTDFPESLLMNVIGKVAGITRPTISTYKNAMLAYKLISNGERKEGRLYLGKMSMPPWMKEVKA